LHFKVTDVGRKR